MDAQDQRRPRQGNPRKEETKEGRGPKAQVRPLGSAALAIFCLLTHFQAAEAESRFFEIQFVDKESGRGIPLVELTTVHDVPYVTDNAGRIAYAESGQEGQEIFFHIRAQGYDVPKDGFGFAGKRFRIEPGQATKVELERVNLAERLYRCTGQELYRDSILLGHETPLGEGRPNGKIAGQDSVQAAIYRGKIHWFWGDTNRLSYPLGLFRTAGAVSQLRAEGGLQPSKGIDYTYFTNKDGFARAMVETPEKEGVIWVDGLCTVPDARGTTRLVAHFSRRKGLADELGHGLLIYDDARQIFTVAGTRALTDQWTHLAHHPVMISETHLGFGGPFPITRVPAELDAILDPVRYESFSCRDLKSGVPRRDESGTLVWQWQPGPPVTQNDEWKWIERGLLKPEEARFVPTDAANPARRLLMHHGTVRWNPWRKRWIMIATESATTKDSPSFLGEVWYSEAESPQGPWRKAVRILTHDKQSFYNPCHHPFFDEDDGRVIYFEGTYCNTFTDSPPTPRYNYNQVMYRLDLAHPELNNPFRGGND